MYFSYFRHLVNDRLKLTRFLHLKLTHVFGCKAHRRAALI